MQIIREMDIKAEDFFNAIVSSVLYDVSMATGKKITKDKLYNGYSYLKNIKGKKDSKGNIKITIEELKEPSIYQAKVTSAKGDNYLKYEINKISGGRIEVKYSESFEGSTKANGWNYKIVSKFYKKKFEKRSNIILDRIEAWINQNK